MAATTTTEPEILSDGLNQVEAIQAVAEELRQLRLTISELISVLREKV